MSFLQFLSPNKPLPPGNKNKDKFLPDQHSSPVTMAMAGKDFFSEEATRQILMRIANVFNDPDLCDAVFVVGQQREEICTPSQFMAVSSPYFKSLFYPPTGENRKEVPDVDPVVRRGLLITYWYPMRNAGVLSVFRSSARFWTTCSEAGCRWGPSTTRGRWAKRRINQTRSARIDTSHFRR